MAVGVFTIACVLDYLKSGWKDEWRPVSRWSAYLWTAFFGLYLAYAWSRQGNNLIVDPANLVVHEAGHALFGWFGAQLGLWGGTIFQLLVPFALASHFFFQRQAPACAFCLFFFFENFLGISTYMADARALGLPLVSLGDPESVIHDWHAIFGGLGLLAYDTRIAALVRLTGWLGMTLVPLWLVRRSIFTSQLPAG